MAASSFMKIVFVCVQIFVILLGLGLVIVGSWAEVESNRYEELIALKELQYGPYLAIASGCALVLVSVVGLVGACCETKINKFLLSFFIILLSIIAIGQLASGILSLVYRDMSEKLIRNELNTTFYQYGNVSMNDTRAAWDHIQSTFRCCGVNGVNDWVMFNANFSLVIDLYPTSCCTNTTDSNCGKIQGVNRNVFTEGCQDVLVDTARRILLIAGTVAFVFLIGEILIIATTIFLLCLSDFDD